MFSIKKTIICTAGKGTRFLPLSRIVPKEFWPLAGKPMLQYLVEEAKSSGSSHIIFVLTFSFVVQKTPLGDGHAILQASRLVGKEPCGVLFVDDIVISDTPCLKQLTKTFKTCDKPVLALARVTQERISQYGIVQVERIASRLYKVKKIVEKPSENEAPSDLAIVGKYILTPEVFDYLKQAKPGLNGEIVLAEVLNKMIEDGKVVYGYEFDGEWLECGTKEGWMISNIRLALKDPKWQKELEKLKII